MDKYWYFILAVEDKQLVRQHKYAEYIKMRSVTNMICPIFAYLKLLNWYQALHMMQLVAIIAKNTKRYHKLHNRESFVGRIQCKTGHNFEQAQGQAEQGYKCSCFPQGQYPMGGLSLLVSHIGVGFHDEVFVHGEHVEQYHVVVGIELIQICSIIISMDISEVITKRLDSLPFSRWHVGMIVAIGTIWIFDGYQVSLVSLFSKYILNDHSETQYKTLANMYQIGCIFGSILFGVLAYFYGRRSVFMVTLMIYGVGVVLCLFGDVFELFMMGRLLTGISVGGQFTAIFTAVDQFLPPYVRGRTNIIIDGTWHLGGCIASILNLAVGDTQKWKYFFLVGLLGLLGLAIIRKSIPESPRWLIMKNRNTQAQNIVSGIENSVLNQNFFFTPTTQPLALTQKQKPQIKFHSLNKEQDHKSQQQQAPQLKQSYEQQAEILHEQHHNNIFLEIKLIIMEYKLRFVISCLLIYVQAFFFNSIYYQYPIFLKDMFNMSQRQISGYMLGLSFCSFVSTLLVGPFFDIVGRQKMLLVTYCITGFLLPFSSLIKQNSVQIQILTCVIFIFGSPASSAANLIASQIFPTSTRPIVLSIIFVCGMFGGMCGVWVNNYYVSGGLMILGGIIGFFLCPKAENKSLEEINKLNNQD